LLDEAAAVDAQVHTHCSVDAIEQVGERHFRLRTTLGVIECGALVIASGGLSIPSMGASGFGYAVARQSGHQVLATRAGLVPLTLSGKHLEPLQDLSGVAFEIEARCNGAGFRNRMLLTHRGLSGPAILQISSYWQPGAQLDLDLLPALDAADWLVAQQRRRPDAGLHRRAARVLPG